jgi:hypothetical protein
MPAPSRRYRGGGDGSAGKPRFPAIPAKPVLAHARRGNRIAWTPAFARATMTGGAIPAKNRGPDKRDPRYQNFRPRPVLAPGTMAAQPSLVPVIPAKLVLAKARSGNRIAWTPAFARATMTGGAIPAKNRGPEQRDPRYQNFRPRPVLAPGAMAANRSPRSVPQLTSGFSHNRTAVPFSLSERSDASSISTTLSPARPSLIGRSPVLMHFTK